MRKNLIFSKKNSWMTPNQEIYVGVIETNLQWNVVCFFLLLSCSRGFHGFFFTRLLRVFYVLLRRFYDNCLCQYKPHRYQSRYSNNPPWFTKNHEPKFRQKGRRKIWGKFEEWVQPDTSANTKHYATAIPNTANFGCAAEAPMIW